jgi:hypothetical protein
VERLAFLDVMFGDKPALSPAELVYQRLLARDPVEAAEQAEKFLKDKPLIAYYDEVLIEGLRLAQADAERGLLDDGLKLRIRDSVAELVDDLGDHQDKLVAPGPEDTDDAATPLAQLDAAEKSPGPLVRELPPRWRTQKPVLCIPGLGLLDETVALMVAQLVERQGIGARAEQADALSMARVFGLDTKEVALICLCYVENATSAQVRYAVRRLRRKAPNAFILVALVGAADNLDEQAVREFGDVGLVKPSLTETVERILEASSASVKETGTAADEPETDLPSENTPVQNDRGNCFGIPREDAKTHAMIV